MTSITSDTSKEPWRDFWNTKSIKPGEAKGTLDRTGEIRNLQKSPMKIIVNEERLQLLRRKFPDLKLETS